MARWYAPDHLAALRAEGDRVREEESSEVLAELLALAPEARRAVGRDRLQRLTHDDHRRFLHSLAAGSSSEPADDDDGADDWLNWMMEARTASPTPVGPPELVVPPAPEPSPAQVAIRPAVPTPPKLQPKPASPTVREFEGRRLAGRASLAWAEQQKHAQAVRAKAHIRSFAARLGMCALVGLAAVVLYSIAQLQRGINPLAILQPLL